MQIVNEGAIKLRIPNAAKISKEMQVFYNPAMGLNRDISVLLLNSLKKFNMQIADPLAASGVRSIRFLKELGKGQIKKIYINDYSKDAVKLIKGNLGLSKINYKNSKKISIANLDANLFLLMSAGFDYIDIDPFGSPNFLLDSSIKRLTRNGILAVTATDTSALCGTFPNACLRKYWAIPKRDALMHETGLRILIRKTQLVAAQYGKALSPILSYSRKHYMRVFLESAKGKSHVDNILRQHGYFNSTGPMWLGRLFDENLAKKIYQNSLKNKNFNQNKELIKFLKIIKEESKINTIGFYDLNDICSKYKIKDMQKKEFIISKIKKMGYNAGETHFKSEGVRSDVPINRLIKILIGKDD